MRITPAMKLGCSSVESILSHRNGCNMIEKSLLLLVVVVVVVVDRLEFGSFAILGGSEMKKVGEGKRTIQSV